MDINQIEVIVIATASVFAFKSLDCTFNTIKTVYMQNNKYFLGAVFNAVSAGFFNISVLITGNIEITMQTIITTLAICMATFFATWLPAAWMKRREPDQMYIYEITSDGMENGKAFADMLLENNIPIKTAKAYINKKKVLNIKAFSESKTTSRFIERKLASSKYSNFDWNAYIPQRIQQS